MRVVLLAGLLLGLASPAAGQDPEPLDRGLWGRVNLTGGLSSRAGDDYSPGTSFGIDLAAGAKRGRSTLLGAELDLRFVLGHDGSDFQGAGYQAALLGVLTTYRTASPLFLQLGLGVGLDGEWADYSYASVGPVARFGVGLGSGVIAPTVVVTAMLPVSKSDVRSNQDFTARFGVEVGLAFTFR